MKNAILVRSWQEDRFPATENTMDHMVPKQRKSLWTSGRRLKNGKRKTVDSNSVSCEAGTKKNEEGTDNAI